MENTKKLKVIIVDDEPLAREVLEAHVSHIPELDLIASCEDAIEANDIIQSSDVDIVLLDIEMPQLTGIEFVKMLQTPPRIIFTTAYPNYAIEGFELDATDYLLKPISFNRFLQAINRAKEEINLRESTQESAPKSGNENFIYVKADKKLVKIAYSEILYIKGLKDYVIIKRDNDRIIALQTMKFLEKTLPSDKFIRIHRSYIIALDRIEAVNGNMVEIIEKGEKVTLPVGKSYRDELLDLINKNRI